MVKIVADTSTLFSSEEGNKHGITITPLSVNIAKDTYRELDEITSAQFLERLQGGALPTSSQPSIGEKMEQYELLAKADEVQDITMADGLSGTYESACNAKADCVYGDRITVLNSETLCGPHRYLVLKAVRLAEQGNSVSMIVDALRSSMMQERSFLIPRDFSFLKRGGRLTPLAATIGGMLKVVPVMTLTEDHRRLEKYTMKRTMGKGIEAIIECFEQMGVDETYYMTITHADVQEDALKVKERMQAAFPHTEIDVFELSPVFITQGGPGCIAVQVIKK